MDGRKDASPSYGIRHCMASGGHNAQVCFPLPFTELACLDLLELPKHCEDICCLPLNACDVLMPEGCLQNVEDGLNSVWNVVKDESGRRVWQEKQPSAKEFQVQENAHTQIRETGQEHEQCH